MRASQRISALVTTLCILNGCGVDRSQGDTTNGGAQSPTNPAVTLQIALERVVDDTIVPRVVDFSSSTKTLISGAAAFCASPDQVGLTTVQNNWRSTFEQWYRLSIYNFGPLNDDIIFPPYTFIDSLRLRGTDYIETVRSEIARDIDSEITLSDDYFKSKTFQRVGLLALESALFETSTAEHSKTPNDIIADYENQPRKCDVLLGLARQLEERATYIEQSWTNDYQDAGQSYRTLFLSGQLEDGTAPINQIVISGQEFLDYLQARRVAATAGQLAMHSWEAISATIDEIEALLKNGEAKGTSIFDVMRETGNQNAVAVVEDSIRQIRKAITDRDVDMLEITLGYLDGHFKREIPDSLDVELGINFSDGD